MHCPEEVGSIAIAAMPKLEKQTHRNAFQALIETTTASVHSSTKAAKLNAVARENARMGYADHLVEITKIVIGSQEIMVEPVAETIVETIKSDDEQRKHNMMSNRSLNTSKS